ncbi:MAG: hypothetical protein ACD_39C02058G0002 [uncultured bacterium]|nr:MAG: hypothetical protein ACD_39C02058G0002 [uncultured bacterium]
MIRHAARCISILVVLAFMIPVGICEAAADAIFPEPVYELASGEESLSMIFLQSWSFDRIELPSVSEQFWGEAKQCRAAIIKVAGRSFVSRLSNSENQLQFNLAGVVCKEFQIIPLLKVGTVRPAGDVPKFDATPARIRMIEDELKELAESVLHFQKRNNCFSCHTAMPMALTCKVAAAYGYRIPDSTLSQIGSSIAGMQSYNGSYSFKEHPDYGTITTTLCAGAIMAIISDFSSQFLENLQKIRRLLPEWLDDDGRLKSDFYFRPLFIGHKTNMLFEAMILQTLYLYSASDDPEIFDDSLRVRLKELRKMADFDPAEPIHRQILLMAGTPVLFQFNTNERPLIVKQLQHLLKNEPEGERSDIRALALFLLEKFSPGLGSQVAKKRPVQNLGDKIWTCFEQIVTSLPTEAKNNQISADNSEQ